MLSSRLCVLSLALLLAACAGQPQRPAPVSKTPAPGVKIGNPYVVFGKRYVPHDNREYDERGIASWYGPTFHAKPTANGEIYNQDDVTAAHKTLPMPSWVEVTNLDNGRKLTVRVNDRGPFVDGRIIDLSRRSAQLLGVDRVGLANVRVRRVYPPHDWARNTAPIGRHVATAEAYQPAPVHTVAAVVQPTVPTPVRPATPVAPPPATPMIVPTPVPASTVARENSSFVQVAALSDQGRAEWLAQNLRTFGPSGTQAAGNGLWRVRLGPFSSMQAYQILSEIRLAGYPDARLVHAE